MLSVLVSAGLIIFDDSVIRIFNQNQELVCTVSKALPVFSLSFIPMAFNLVYTSLLYSTKRTKQSDIIAHFFWYVPAYLYNRINHSGRIFSHLLHFLNFLITKSAGKDKG